jgi:phospholipid/cholesterol/gamma-HCH transport system substrate-binding protein
MDLRISKFGIVLLLAVSILAIGLLGYLVPRFGGPQIRLSTPYNVSATFTDSLGLEKSGDVWVRGVKVGSVSGLDTHGDTVTVHMDIDGKYKPLYRDASIRIGEKTPLGEAYVDLLPGHRSAGALRSGSQVAHVEKTVTTDQALRALDGPARNDLSATFRTFAGGAKAPDTTAQVHGTIANAAGTVQALHMISETLSAQDHQVSDLVGSSSTVLRVIGQRESSLRQIVSGGTATMDAVAGQRDALRAMLTELPSLLKTTRSTLTDARPLLVDARPAIADLRSAAPRLTPALQQLGPVARNADAVLQGLHAFDTVAKPVLSTGTNVVKTAVPVVNDATTAMENFIPVLNYLEPRKNALAGWFSNTRASSDHGDASGKFWRFNIFVEPSTSLGVKGNFESNPYTLPNDALNNQPYKPGDYQPLVPYVPSP